MGQPAQCEIPSYAYDAHACTCTHTHIRTHTCTCLSHIHTPTFSFTDATIECPNKMPVAEGSSVFIWCGTGLSDSRVVQTTFVFGGRKGICASSYVHSGWRVSRNESEPYTCGLHIENIQPSDSGEYYCEVNLPGTLDTVRSTIVHVEVASTNPNPNPNPNVLILETVIPSVGGLLILVIPALIITVACIVIRKHRQGRHHDDQVPYNEDDLRNNLLPRNQHGKIISFNYMNIVLHTL